MAGQTDDALLDSLRTLTGNPAARFRDGQREAVDALVTKRERVLVVQRTGWGKSAVYFLSTHLLRHSGSGPTLLVSPLLALMRNQIEAAERLGLRCMTINSASQTTVNELEAELRADQVDLLLVSPERLANPDFGSKIMPLVGARPGLIVIDEVHCISDWGHDFRPDYRRIGRIVDRLSGSDVPVLGCTATANDRVVNDVAAQLGAEMTTFRGPLRREGLALSALLLDRPAERLAWLAETIPELPGSGIVYVLVATTALGMGYDKPDLSFVVHYQAPGSPVGYYQQVGRAGRALDASIGVLLRGLEDEQIQDYFIERAFADEYIVSDVLSAFDEANGPVSLIRVQNRLNVKWATLELVVKQLDVDGALNRVGGQSFERTLQPYDYPARRIDSVTEARRLEQQAMRDYFDWQYCRMRFLANLLDDDTDDDCGICDNCLGESVGRDLPIELVAAAERFLLHRPIDVVCKKQRYDPAEGRRRRIPDELRLADGRALSIWGDSGWGTLVRQGKQHDGVYDPRLVDAFVEMYHDWAPEPPPVWVTSVPSLRHPTLVEPMAREIAKSLGLPYMSSVEKIAERPAQRTQQNSAHQQRNIEGAFAVVDAVPEQPVLLIDDVVDSSWTFTEIGGLLRNAGASVVYPVALASSAGRS